MLDHCDFVEQLSVETKGWDAPCAYYEMVARRAGAKAAESAADIQKAPIVISGESDSGYSHL